MTLHDIKLHGHKKDANSNNNNNGKGVGVTVDVNGHELAIFNWQNRLYCVDEKCPHAGMRLVITSKNFNFNEGGPLHLGDIEEIGYHPCIICPWHKFSFQLTNGKIVYPHKRSEQLQTYPIKLDKAGLIVIGFRSFSPLFFKDNNF